MTKRKAVQLFMAGMADKIPAFTICFPMMNISLMPSEPFIK